MGRTVWTLVVALLALAGVGAAEGPRAQVDLLADADKLEPQGALGYPVEVLPRGNRTTFAIETMLNGKLQVVALGKDGQIWHVFQLANGTWVNWRQLTTVCPAGADRERVCRFDGDPAIGRNKDGRLEVFMRFAENLDLWQMYQTDPTDPTQWSMPREGSCVDQDQSTAVWTCLQAGVPSNQSESHYWIIDSPVFPTSDVTVLQDRSSGKLQVFYRNFEGHMYKVEQLVAGRSERYTTPTIMTSTVLFI